MYSGTIHTKPSYWEISRLHARASSEEKLSEDWIIAGMSVSWKTGSFQWARSTMEILVFDGRLRWITERASLRTLGARRSGRTEARIMAMFFGVAVGFWTAIAGDL